MYQRRPYQDFDYPAIKVQIDTYVSLKVPDSRDQHSTMLTNATYFIAVTLCLWVPSAAQLSLSTNHTIPHLVRDHTARRTFLMVHLFAFNYNSELVRNKALT